LPDLRASLRLPRHRRLYVREMKYSACDGLRQTFRVRGRAEDADAEE
jgi:hypothetical protein